VTNLLDIQNISYSINSEKILRNVSLKIQSNMMYQFIGGNGAGKTTLLKIILEIMPPSKGKIFKHQSFSKKYIGHKIPLKNYLTLDENLKIYLNNFSETKLIDTLKKLNLYDKRDTKFSSLSYGQQRKAALIPIFVETHEMFLLDEPFSGLDNAHIEIIKKEMISLVDNGKTVIFTSHIPAELECETLRL